MRKDTINVFDNRCFPRDIEVETTLTIRSNEARKNAEASFKKEERVKEGTPAVTEYQANNQMVREKTERLKALRMAKEAADRARSGESFAALKGTHPRSI
jgi:hypothetical protein